jgi:hypothetical protein
MGKWIKRQERSDKMKRAGFPMVPSMENQNVPLLEMDLIPGFEPLARIQSDDPFLFREVLP